MSPAISRSRKEREAVLSVESMTQPGKAYQLIVYKDGEVWCTCPRHRFKPALRPCKHIKAYQFSVQASFAPSIGRAIEVLVPADRLGSADDEAFILSLAQTI